MEEKKTYSPPSTSICHTSLERGVCDVIGWASPSDDFSNTRGRYLEEGDEKWGDLWAEEEE